MSSDALYFYVTILPDELPYYQLRPLVRETLLVKHEQTDTLRCGSSALRVRIAQSKTQLDPIIVSE